ncbi:hypothetical protein MITS9508_01022 [Synechococcus sp. MIT S9508]|nr:hypothetical protein MITS9508_01022 [Synechococcus sp. MIT S9508]
MEMYIPSDYNGALTENCSERRDQYIPAEESCITARPKNERKSLFKYQVADSSLEIQDSTPGFDWQSHFCFCQH